MEKETIDKKIAKVLNDKQIKEILSQVGKEEIAPVSRVSQLIGEIYTYCFAHNDGTDININQVVKYVTTMRYAYFNCDGNERTLLDVRAKELGKTIATTLNIDFSSGKISNLDAKRIEQYFLHNYVENGYVTHSFSGACEDSIRKNGFSSTTRIWNNDEIMKIADIFDKKNAISPVGAYSHYYGGGAYVENNPKQLYWHALSAPEWFKWFTSANHNKNSSKLEESPYYLKDYEGCKINVQDLCNNADLNQSEKEQVMKMFEENWKSLGTDKTFVALIARKDINKGNIQDAIIPGQSVLETIKTVLSDGRGQFKEHFGNVLKHTITEKDMLIMELPSSKEIFGEHEFSRETKEKLYDPSLVLDMVFRGRMLSGFNISDSKIDSIIDTLKTVHKNSRQVQKEIEKYKNRVSLFDEQEIGKATINALTANKDKAYNMIKLDEKEVAKSKQSSEIEK